MGDDGVALDAPRLDPAKVCQLRLSYIGTNEHAITTVGTLRDDAKGILGLPESETATPDYLLMAYRWCVGTNCYTHATMELTFKPLSMCWRESGKPVSGSWWLTRVDVSKMPYPDCIDPEMHRPNEGATCDGCTSPNQVTACAGEK